MKKRKYKRSRLKKTNGLLRDLLVIPWIVLGFAPLPLIFHIRNVIARSDPGVIATRTSASLFWGTPLLFYWCVTLAVLVFPLIDKMGSRYREQPCYAVKQAKRLRRTGVILWSIGFVFVLLLSLLSLSGRECLTEDGRLQRYNMFNRLVDEYAADEVTGIQLRTVQEPRHFAHDYTYGIWLYVEDDDFYFDCGNFFLGERDTLWELLAIRKRYEPNVTLTSTPKQLESVVRDRELSEEETALLYELFDKTS